MGEVKVGTCSWTDKALVSSGWYPPGHRDAEGRLRHYATQFPVVEVDATYYGLPSTRNSLLWAERTPPGFRFNVKAFSLLTGHPTRPAALPPELRPALARQPGRGGTDPDLLDEVWDRFSGALEPLRRADRLGTLLFQFPRQLAPGRPGAEFLRRCRERAAGWPVAVEFRHPGWWRAEHLTATAALLTDLDVSAVAVDMAQTLPGSVPRSPGSPPRNSPWSASTAAARPGERARRRTGSATPTRPGNCPSGPRGSAPSPSRPARCTSCSTTAAATRLPAPPSRCAPSSTSGHRSRAERAPCLRRHHGLRSGS